MSKFEIQKWLKTHKIAYTPFQNKEDLLYIVGENKKVVCDAAKAAKKAAKLEAENPSQATAQPSSPYARTSSVIKPATRSLTSPFKKMTFKDGQIVRADEADASSAVSDNAIRHIKSLSKVGLASRLDNNTLYVFISSTFKDMIGERDHLIKSVFPALNIKAKSKNLTVVPVDLRWGLTKEETTVKGQIELCLKQIDKCPITICALGSRYGWVPPEYKAEVAESWLASVPPGQSITALEVQYALDKPDRQHCIGVLRDNGRLATSIPATHADSFKCESADATQRLSDLRATILAHPTCSTLENYPCSYGGADKSGNPYVRGLDAFGTFIFDQLWEIIELELPNPIQAPDPIQLEDSFHTNYLKLRSQSYFGRENLQKKLMAHVTDKGASIDKFGVVYGEPGSGKSSSLAFFAKTLQSDPSFLVLYHFVGCSSASIDVVNILHRFSHKLVNTLKLKMEVSDNHEKLRIDFPVILAAAAKSKKIVIIIDDLDEMSTANQAHQVEWLPDSSELGDRVFVLLSCDQNKPCWDYLHLRSKIPHTFYLTPLEMAERQLIATRTLEACGKKLESKLLDKLISKTHAKFPLFIKLVCEELRIFGSFDRLAAFVTKLPETTEQLIGSIVSRLEDDFGKDIIKKTLCFIALARFGLGEGELVELLRERNKAPVPFSVWAPLLANITPLLRSDEARSSIAFFHGAITRVIVARYLPSEKASIVVQQTLADFYLARADPDTSRTWTGRDIRPFIEAPVHLMRAKRWDSLATLFTDLAFIETSFRLGIGRALIEVLLAALTEIRSPTISGERWQGLNFSSANTVEDFAAFVQYQAHLLAKFPYIAAQQAANMPDDSVVATTASRLLNNTRAAYLRWVNKSQMSDFVIGTLSGHEDFVRCALYRDDGGMVASCGDDRTVRLWSGETNGLVRIFPKLHTDKVTNLIWYKNTIFSVSRDMRIVQWDEYGKVLGEFTGGHKAAVWAVDVASNGKRLVTGSWDKNAVVWDVETRQVVHTLPHGNKLSAVAFSRNGRLIAAGCWSGIVSIWDAATGKKTKEVKVSESSILFLHFSPDDTTIAASSVDTCIHIINTSTWVRTQKLEGHKEAVISARFATDGKYLVSCSDDKTVRVFDTHDWLQVSLMTGHSGRIISAAFHPDSGKRRVITAATDKTIRIWDPKLGYGVALAHQGHRKSCTHVHYDAASEQLISASDDRSVRTWTRFNSSDLLENGQTIDIGMRHISWLTDGRAVGVVDGIVQTLDIPSGKVVAKIEGHTGCSYSSSTACGKHVAMVFKEGAVIIHDTETKSDIYNSRHGFVVNEVNYSPEGDYLAICDGKGTVTVLRRSGQRYTEAKYITLEPLTPVTGMTWNSTGTVLAVGSTDGFVHLFDARRSFELIRILRGHAFSVRGLAFSPGGKYLISASLDKQAILWNVELGSIISVFPLASISTSNAIFFRDSSEVLTIVLADYTGKIHHLKLHNCTD
eukprot:gene4222-4918_t